MKPSLPPPLPPLDSGITLFASPAKAPVGLMGWLPAPCHLSQLLNPAGLIVRLMHSQVPGNPDLWFGVTGGHSSPPPLWRSPEVPPPHSIHPIPSHSIPPHPTPPHQSLWMTPVAPLATTRLSGMQSLYSQRGFSILCMPGSLSCWFRIRQLVPKFHREPPNKAEELLAVPKACFGSLSSAL